MAAFALKLGSRLCHGTRYMNKKHSRGMPPRGMPLRGMPPSGDAPRDMPPSGDDQQSRGGLTHEGEATKYLQTITDSITVACSYSARDVTHARGPSGSRQSLSINQMLPTTVVFCFESISQCPRC